MAAALFTTCSTGDKFHDPLAEGYRNSVVQEQLRAQNLFNGFVPVMSLDKDKLNVFGAYSEKAQSTLVEENLKYLQLTGFTQRAEKILAELNGFLEGVKERGNKLQNGTATDKPTLYQLQVERYDMLFKHHKVYVVAYQRVCELARQLDKSIERCKPLTRTAAEEKAFREQAPECHSEMKKAEEACKGYLSDLITAHQAVVDLRDKLLAKLTENTGTGYMWAIQRVCMIVDNGGNPLNAGSRLNNKLFNPVIPPFPEKYPEQPKPVTPGEVPPSSPGVLTTLYRSLSRSNSPAPGATAPGTSPTPTPPPAILSASVPPPAADVLPGQEGKSPLSTSTV